jgi:sigma-54 dependent transcriptional regulator, acetoin dehydrogenase operon transcriptional activator AcoR
LRWVAQMIIEQKFREDLYYRLNGLAVRMPPLRERSDLLALAQRIVERESAPHPLQLSPAVIQLLQNYAWPGNVRQLFNVLRTACVMAAGESMIMRAHLPDDFLDDLGAAPKPASEAATVAAPLPVAEPQAVAAPAPLAIPEAARSLGEIEIDVIQRAVDAAGGNISEAAKRLGISRNTIYRRLRWNLPQA